MTTVMGEQAGVTCLCEDSRNVLLALRDLERVRVAHDVHRAHVPANLAADGTLAHLSSAVYFSRTAVS